MEGYQPIVRSSIGPERRLEQDDKYEDYEENNETDERVAHPLVVEESAPVAVIRTQHGVPTGPTFARVPAMNRPTAVAFPFCHCSG